MPYPEAVKIVITALLILAVFTGIGLAVTMVVASVLLEYRSQAALERLRDFGDVEFLPRQKWFDPDWQMYEELKPDRLQWTLDKEALRRMLFRPSVTVLPRLAGMAAVVAALVFALRKWSVLFPESDAGVMEALSLGGIAATAALLVFWQGQKISAAAGPRLKELEPISREVIAVGETAGWRFITEAPPDAGGLSRYLESHDDTLHLNYLATAARYFAEHPWRRWRDDAALLRLAIDATRRGLQRGNRHFPRRRPATGRRWPSAAKRKSSSKPRVSVFQLFSGSVRTMLAEVACGGDMEEYQRTIAAIREEIEELTAAAQARRMNKTEACIVLGVKPEAEAEEINRTFRSLLELWRPAGDDDKFARDRCAELQQAHAFLKSHGHA